MIWQGLLFGLTALVLWKIGPNAMPSFCDCSPTDPVRERLPVDLAISSLPKKIAIYVPTTLCPSPELAAVCLSCSEALSCFTMTPMEEQQYKTRTLELLARLFGGGYCFHVDGIYYSSDRDAFVAETTWICTSFTAKEVEKELGTVVNYIQQLGKELGQEAMALEVDGVLHFLPAASAIQNGTKLFNAIDL